MLFNTYFFIYLFLPLTLLVYFTLNRFRMITSAKLWLTASSLFFYGWWNIKYIPLILASIGFNYAIGRLLSETSPARHKLRLSRRKVLIGGIAADLLLLGYYKYADFFLANLNALTGQGIAPLAIILPLGISFFTFTQIAYLVDAYRGKAKEYNILSYMLFVTFYPHLIAGPILHHSEMMPQFDRLRSKLWSWPNASRGVYIFCIGLFKKVVVADTFAIYANNGFEHADRFLQSWVAALSYTLQLYFDFSGYTDMAIGAALLFNIKLPQNFNSPYKALSIQDFWRRWHMTLSRFLRDYIYIPLGGSRSGEYMTIRNVMITFLLGGLWHGAGWTFIAWGFLHGAGQAVHRLWSKSGRSLPKWLAWTVTFVFITITWVFFRAENWQQAVRILKGMTGLYGTGITIWQSSFVPLVLILIAMPIVLFAPNSSERMQSFRPNWKTALWLAIGFIISMVYMNHVSEFLYFNF
ncbi:MBOAT family O-acyltransferase [Paenibacillus sepulcri]|uniref:MBOAT family protein n=1 Tax=Paenibacillus sepulcri TaxID=359917 RepID=A0ABS7CCZ6_9BACL|nr:MBOAT family protein [Paenibacillus sepulcri]